QERGTVCEPRSSNIIGYVEVREVSLKRTDRDPFDHDTVRVAQRTAIVICTSAGVRLVAGHDRVPVEVEPPGRRRHLRPVLIEGSLQRNAATLRLQLHVDVCLEQVMRIELLPVTPVTDVAVAVRGRASKVNLDLPGLGGYGQLRLEESPGNEAFVLIVLGCNADRAPDR